MTLCRVQSRHDICPTQSKPPSICWAVRRQIGLAVLGTASMCHSRNPHRLADLLCLTQSPTSLLISRQGPRYLNPALQSAFNLTHKVWDARRTAGVEPSGSESPAEMLLHGLVVQLSYQKACEWALQDVQPVCQLRCQKTSSKRVLSALLP